MQRSTFKVNTFMMKKWLIESTNYKYMHKTLVYGSLCNAKAIIGDTQLTVFALKVDRTIH